MLFERTEAQLAVLGGRTLAIGGCILTLLGILGFRVVDLGGQTTSGILLGVGFLCTILGGCLTQHYRAQAKADSHVSKSDIMTSNSVIQSNNPSLSASPESSGYDQLPPPEAQYASSTYNGNQAPVQSQVGIVIIAGDMERPPPFAADMETPPPFAPPTDCTPAQFAPEFTEPTAPPEHGKF